MILAIGTPFRRIALLLVIGCSPLLGDQPIMNMMPRWDGGYGVQVLAETIHRSDLKLRDVVVGKGYSENIQLLHLQGVYTWDRSVRFTFKLPYVVSAKREVLGINNEKVVQHNQDIGDLTLALPLKQYFNLSTRSGNWSIVPQIIIPLGAADNEHNYSVANRIWGSGISLGYETETYHWFFAASVSAWAYECRKANLWGGSIDLGLKSGDRLLYLWESDFKLDAEDAFILSAGPAVYYRFSDTIHTRFEWKHDFISRVSKRQAEYANGDRISFGIGFVF
ncbi:MAG: hypothetical protein VXX82_02165, partial [Verrucomicrobiota bacterium]|nr:hypothetical protein [Verrucomicrobiota bacterium]